MAFDDGDQVFEHPSYGKVQVSRITGGIGTLYGSNIQHTSAVRLRICRSEHRRTLSNDWYHDAGGQAELIEVDLSPVQFTELITSMNCGSGIPCTIRFIRGEGLISAPPPIEDRKLFEEEFATKARKVARLMDEALGMAREMADGAAPNKAARKALVGRLEMARQEIASNMPFVAEQFAEQMEKTVTAAKAEVDAFVTHVVQETGLQAIREARVAIGEPVVYEVPSIEDERIEP